MRCPKCGYNSFDHNLTCPKCRKDLTAIRRILNLNIPVPGNVNFFHISSERAVFAEPILGGNDPAYGPASMDMGLSGAPQGFESSFMPTAAASMAAPVMAGLAELTPTADDDFDDITPVDSSDDIDDIAPVDFSDGLSQQAAPAPDLADYIAAAPARPAAAMMASAVPVGDDEEIEIEIDPEENQPMPASTTFMASPTPVAQPPQANPAASIQAQAAMDQIKSALSQTGDLGQAAPEVYTPDLQAEGLADAESAEIEYPADDFEAALEDDQAPAEYDFPVGDFGAAPQDDQPVVEEFDFPVGDFGAAPQDDQPVVEEFDFPVGDFGAAPQDDQPMVDDFELPVEDFGAAPQDDQPVVEEFDFPVGDFGAMPQDAADPAMVEPDIFIETEDEPGGGTIVAPVAVPEIPADSFDDQLADATFSVPNARSPEDGDDLSSMVGDLDLDDLDNDL